MNGKQVEEVVRAALLKHHDAIYDFITAGYAKERVSTKGIEQAFENAFKATLPRASSKKRATLEDIGTKQPPFSGRERGFIDVFIPELASGFELKAVRLPRKCQTGLTNRRFDFGQLVADHFRMANAKKLRWSYLVVFVYGPLVEDAASAFRLYETFHNALFLDAYIATNFDRRPDQDRDQRKTLAKMKLLKPWTDAKSYPERTFAVKHEKLGAIIVGCRFDDG